MRNLMLKLQYDGTAYAGWQRQKNALSVQEVLEDALARLTGEKTSVTGCGRTDGGVHARAYVCNFKTESKLDTDRFVSALNALTPNDIVVYACDEVSQDFHARFQTVSKTYLYQIDHSLCGDVFLQRYAWHYPYFLDVEKMRREAEAFVGVHDFRGFMSAGSSVKDTVREIYSCKVEQTGDLIRIIAKGNGFLYNMVRIMAGTLVYMGNGRIGESLGDILASGDRKRAGITAPPRGLFLYDVEYDGTEKVRGE